MFACSFNFTRDKVQRKLQINIYAYKYRSLEEYTIKISKSFLRLRFLTSSPIILYVYIMRIYALACIPFRSFCAYARIFPLETASNLNDEYKRFRLSYARTFTGTPLTSTRVTPRLVTPFFCLS